MTREEARAYSRGYNAGRRNQWPKHLPPLPPDEVVGPMLEAARDLWNAVDADLATFEENDPSFARIDDAMEAFAEQMSGLTCWLTAHEGGRKS